MVVAPRRCSPAIARRPKARVPFPLAPQDFLTGPHRRSGTGHQGFVRRPHREDRRLGIGRMAIAWINDDGFLSSYCNTVPTRMAAPMRRVARGAHQSLPRLWRTHRNKRVAQSPPTTCSARPPRCSPSSSASRVPGPDQGSAVEPEAGASSRMPCETPSTIG